MSARDFALLRAKMQVALGKSGFLPGTSNSSFSSDTDSKWSEPSTIPRRSGTNCNNWALIVIPLLFLSVVAFYFIVVDVSLASTLLEERENKSTTTQSTLLKFKEIFDNFEDAERRKVTKSQLPETIFSTSESTESNGEMTTELPTTISELLKKKTTISTLKSRLSTTTPRSTTTLNTSPKETTTTTTTTEKSPPSTTFSTTITTTITTTTTKTEPKLKISKGNSSIVILKKGSNGTEFLIEGVSYQPPKEVFEIVSPPNLKDNRDRFRPPQFEEPPVKPLTTPRGFQYSPTVPLIARLQAERADPTSAPYNDTFDANCFSPRIPFCEGVLPYDMVQLPALPDVDSVRDLDAMLPYFQLIMQSGCSQRAREFICAVLEPECKPPGARQPTPCKVNCKVLAEDCRDFILETLPLSRIFDCRRYPDWDENRECVNLSKGTCLRGEFQCPDGSCIPSKWVCDGVNDCPGSRPAVDEQTCSGCSDHEFRCIMDGRCIPQHWQCDGEPDCIDNSDESC